MSRKKESGEQDFFKEVLRQQLEKLEKFPGIPVEAKMEIIAPALIDHFMFYIRLKHKPAMAKFLNDSKSAAQFLRPAALA